MSLPRPDIYYSFNTVDRIGNNVQNWATRYPIYDASLVNVTISAGTSVYISKQNYKTGNGSLEMSKMDISRNPIMSATLTKTAPTLSIAVSDNQLRMVTCEYGGTVSYRTRASRSVAFSAATAITNSGTKTYHGIGITGDGSRLVTCENNSGGGGGYVWFATWNGSSFPQLTQTADGNARVYYGIAITRDGSRIVASTSTNVFFANWNGSNYDVFVQTLQILQTSINYMGICISRNGDRICYAQYGTSVGASGLKTFRLSYWNGNNYSDGILITGATDIGSVNSRHCYFNNDSSLLFLSYYCYSTVSTFGIEVLKYNYATNGYDAFYKFPVSVIPVANGDYHGLCCVDTSNNCNIYASSYGTTNTSMYITDLSYNIKVGSSYCNVLQPTVPSTAGSGLSFAFWFRSNYNITYARICDFGNGAPSDNISIYISSTGSIAITIFYGGTSSVTETSILTQFVNDNNWYHCVFTLAYPATGSATATLTTVCAYLNGGTLQSGSNATIYYPKTITRTNNYLGRSPFTNDNQFFGNIDDFRVYYTVLTADQALSIYNITDVTNNYINSTVYKLYNTSVETNTNDYPSGSITTMGTAQTYFYWNDPTAGASCGSSGFINSVNPYNFKYTYNNSSHTSVIIAVYVDDNFTVKVNGAVVARGGYPNITTTSSIPINIGNNLFEFICVNALSSASFATYVTSGNDGTYLFSTNATKSGWTIEVSGIFSNGYPLSSIIYNESGVAKANITQTFFTLNNTDISSNQATKRIPVENMYLQTNGNDLKNTLFKYP
jgi:hypothetical protein